MKLGLIGSLNNSGIGVIGQFFRKHLPIEYQLAVKVSRKGTYFDMVDCTTTFDFQEFVEYKPDAVIIVEYPYNWDYLRILHENNIPIIFMVMTDCMGFKYIHKFDKYVDLWLCPNQFACEVAGKYGFQDKSVYLPYPIDTDVYKFKARGVDDNLLFLHNRGFGGGGERKGTQSVINAFNSLNTDYPETRLLIRSQLDFDTSKCSSNIEIEVADFADHKYMYSRGDVHIAPSKHEGIGLSLYESMACGIPVIASDIVAYDECMKREFSEFFVTVRDTKKTNPYMDCTICVPDTVSIVKQMKYFIQNSLSKY